MSGEFRNQKMLQLFRCFDYDGNGHVEKSDVEAIASRVAEGQRHAIGSEAHTRLLGAYHAWWNQMSTQMDQNCDGRVSSQEFVEFFQAMAANPQGDVAALLGALCDALFLTADTDNNGTVSSSEFAGLCEAYHVTRSAATKAFEMLDRDQNGLIRKEEWDGFIADLFLTDDITGPGGVVMSSVPSRSKA